MVKRSFTFTFPPELIREPIIYTLGQQFNVITNIQLADISEEKGWAVVELEGEEQDIEEGLTWVTSKGMRVDPAGGDMVGNQA